MKRPELKKLIREMILQELTAYKKRGIELPTSLEELKKYIDVPNIYINLMDLPKIGINPQYGYGNIVGVYGYPLTVETIMKYLSGDLAVGRGRQYINVFRYTPSGDDTIYAERYSKEDLERDIKKLTRLYGKHNVDIGINDTVKRHGKSLDHKRAKLFLSIIERMPGFHSNKLHAVLMELGYNALIDNDYVYMSDTKSQIVVFNPKKIELLERIKNPLDKSQADVLNTLKAHAGKMTPEIETSIKKLMLSSRPAKLINLLLSVISIFKHDATARLFLQEVAQYILEHSSEEKTFKELMDSGIAGIQERVLSQKNIPEGIALLAANSNDPYVLGKVISKVSLVKAIEIMKINKASKEEEVLDSFLRKARKSLNELNSLSQEDKEFVQSLLSL